MSVSKFIRVSRDRALYGARTRAMARVRVNLIIVVGHFNFGLYFDTQRKTGSSTQLTDAGAKTGTSVRNQAKIGPKHYVFLDLSIN